MITVSSALSQEYEAREVLMFKLPALNPNKCKAKVIRYHLIPERSTKEYYYREQCSRDKGYGPNGQYCKQHAKSIKKKFDI